MLSVCFVCVCVCSERSFYHLLQSDTLTKINSKSNPPPPNFFTQVPLEASRGLAVSLAPVYTNNEINSAKK